MFTSTVKIFVFIVTDAYNHEVALQLQLYSFISHNNQISVFTMVKDRRTCPVKFALVR